VVLEGRRRRHRWQLVRKDMERVYRCRDCGMQRIHHFGGRAVTFETEERTLHSEPECPAPPPAPAP